MVTVNKSLQSLTKQQVEEISEKYLRGWVNIQSEYKIMLRGLNHRREDYGLSKIYRDQVFDYRDKYVKSHYSLEERIKTISDYLATHKMDIQREKGIFLFNCRFDIRYAKAFRSLIGKEKFDSISEKKRVSKMMNTQNEQYGGVGLGSQQTLAHAQKTKINKFVIEMNKFLKTGVASVYLSNSVSTTELLAFKKLVNHFGRDDIFYQYGLTPYDSRYPFNCDFYIKSEDLFIELNYHYSHGGHWYDDNDSFDHGRYLRWKQSSNLKYQNAANIWKNLDLKKREFAQKNELNYLVFWEAKYLHSGSKKSGIQLIDFDNWLDDYKGNFKEFINDNPKNSY